MRGSTASIGGAGFTVRSVSAAVNTCAPAASAADLSIPVIFPWARYERTNVRWSAPGQLEVVHVATLASEEARILAATDPLSYDVGQSAQKLCTPAPRAVVRQRSAAIRRCPAALS